MVRRGRRNLDAEQDNYGIGSFFWTDIDSSSRRGVRLGKLGGLPRVGYFDGMLRVFFVGAIVLCSLPAVAELRIVQSALTKPFPSVGDAVVGCRDPADTAHWIEIITGKLFERDVQDGQGQTLRPSLRDVAIAVGGFFHAYIATNECFGYEDGDQVTIEAQGRRYGIDMMCASDSHGGCYWIPAIDLQGDDGDYSAAPRR